VGQTGANVDLFLTIIVNNERCLSHDACISDAGPTTQTSRRIAINKRTHIADKIPSLLK